MNIKEAFCPECDNRLKFKNYPHIGQRVVCNECEASLAVVSVRPIELDIALTAGASSQSRKEGQNTEGYCPECDAGVRLNSHPREGQQIKCRMCQTILEVVSIDPLELEMALVADVKVKNRSRLEQYGSPSKKTKQIRR